MTSKSGKTHKQNAQAARILKAIFVASGGVIKGDDSSAFREWLDMIEDGRIKI